MKTKQVVAFLMAATLTVTSGGVSALASQNAAEALQEETAIEELITEGETDGEIREAAVGEKIPDYVIKNGTVVSQEQANFKVEFADSSDRNIEFSDPISLSVKISDKVGRPTIEELLIIDSGNGNEVVAVVPKEDVGDKTEVEVRFVPKVNEDDFSNGGSVTKRYKVVARFQAGGDEKDYYSISSSAVTVHISEKSIEVSEIGLSELGDIEISPENLDADGLDKLKGMDSESKINDPKDGLNALILKAKQKALNAKIKELNKDSRYNQYVKWAEYAETEDKDIGKEVELPFTPKAGYKIVKDGKALENEKVKVSVNWIQKVMRILVELDNPSLSEDGKNEFSIGTKSVNLRAKAYPKDAAKDVDIQWKSSNVKAVKVDVTNDKTLAVAYLVGAGKSTVTATANDGSDVSGSIDITVKDGITPSDIDFSMFPEKMEYKGNANVSEYLSDVLQSANTESNIGTYSIETDGDREVDGSKVKGESGDDLGKGADFDYTVTFTLDDSQIPLSSGNANDDWESDSKPAVYKKHLTLTVVPKVITKDEALKEILGDNMGKTSFPVGTTFSELADTVNGKYDVRWYESDGKTGVKADGYPAMGTNTYVLSFSEGSGFGPGYTLEPGDHTYSMTITIEEPKLEVEIVASTDGHPESRTDYKFHEGEKVELASKVNGKLNATKTLGEFYDLSFNWIYDGKSINKGGEQTGSFRHVIGSDRESTDKNFEKITKGDVGEYSLIVIGTITAKGKQQPWYVNADAATQARYNSLSERASITIELTSIYFGDDVTANIDKKAFEFSDGSTLVYGSTAGKKFKGAIQADNIQSYTVCYREVVDGKEQEEKTLPSHTLTEAERALYASGYTIGEKYDGVDIGNLDAGEYVFYVRVKTSDEEASSNKVQLTVNPKPISAAAYKDKVQVGAIQYGDKYSDAKVSITGDDELNSMLQLKVKEEDVAKKVAPVNVTVVVANKDGLKNYMLADDWKFKKVLDVTAYAATVKLHDKAIALGATPTFDASDWEADIRSVNGETKDKVFKVSFRLKDGTPASAMKNLAPGQYDLMADVDILDSNYSVSGVETATLTVGDGGSETNGIQFNKKQIVFTNIGKTREFAAAVVPATESNAGLTFESSDESVATVEVTDSENGKAVVTAEGNGEADIVVTAPNGVSGKLHVTVKQEPKKVVISRSGKTVSGTISVSVGKKYNFDAKVQPSTVAVKGVKWSTSNARIATVSKKGKVTVKAAGTVKIKATAKGGAKSKTITLKAK